MGDDIGDGICENEPHKHQDLERFFDNNIENSQLTREDDDDDKPSHVDHVKNNSNKFAEMLK